MTMLTEEQRLSFVRDGYLILPQIVSLGLIQAALNHCDTAYATHQYNVPQNASGGKVTPSFWRSVKSAAAVTNLFFESGLFGVTEQLLGRCNVELLNGDGQIAYTMPVVDGKLGVDEKHPQNKWHIDTPLGEYVNRGADFIAIVGVALSEGQDVDENRGQFTVWPGSHLITHATMREIIQTVREKSFVRDDKATKTDEFKGLWQHEADMVIPTFKARKADVGAPRRVLVKRGDAFIAHQRVAHAPGINAWHMTRKNIYFRVRHKRHDELLNEFNLSPTPWVGYEGIGEYVRRGGDRRESEKLEL